MTDTTMHRWRPFENPAEPGKKDSKGTEWWACDPYPTWYRWDGDTLLTRDRLGVYVEWEPDDPAPMTPIGDD